MRLAMALPAFLARPIRRDAGRITLSVVLLALEAAGDLLQPTLMAQLINRGVLARDQAALGFWGAWMLAVVALGALCALGRNWLSSTVSQRFGSDLRDSTFTHVMGLRFDQARKWETAAVLTRLTFDVAQVQNLLNGLMRIYLKAPLLGLGALILAFVLDPLLGLLILPIFPVVFALFWWQANKTLPLFHKSQALLDELSSRVRDFLHGIRVIKGFGRQDHELQGFAAVNGELTANTTKTQVVQAFFSPAVTLTVSLAVVLVLALGGMEPSSSRQIGHLMAFIQYLTQILFSLVVVSNLVGTFSRARTSADRIGELLQTPVGSEPVVRPAQARGVSFQNVGFSYGGDAVLADVSFTFGAGQTLGILGATGSGKTTLLHLLMGFLTPTEGAVLVSEGLSFGYVPQRPLLFSGTLKENLLWGDPLASPTRLEEVLDWADALSFVKSFPEGLDTPLGPGGTNLSGGQKQRITLARALLRRPTVLVLDEAFSALDGETETRIEKRLAQALPETAVVLVAQKVASVRSCDAVLVLDNGRVGWGRHGELLTSSVVYRQICRSQGVEA